jgi:hypothetical protein
VAVAAAVVVVVVAERIILVLTSRELLSGQKGLWFYNFSYDSKFQFLCQITKLFQKKM